MRSAALSLHPLIPTKHERKTLEEVVAVFYASDIDLTLVDAEACQREKTWKCFLHWNVLWLGLLLDPAQNVAFLCFFMRLSLSSAGNYLAGEFWFKGCCCCCCFCKHRSNCRRCLLANSIRASPPLPTVRSIHGRSVGNASTCAWFEAEELGAETFVGEASTRPRSCLLPALLVCRADMGGKLGRGGIEGEC